MRNQDAPGPRRKVQLFGVACSREPDFRGACDVNRSPSQSSGDTERYILVQVKADAHRSGCFFNGWAVQLRLKGGRSVAAELFCQRAFRADFFLNLFAVIVVIRQGGVSVRESDGRNVRDDLVRRPSILFVPDRHIEHSNSMARDAGAPAANPGSFGDALRVDAHDYRISL